MYYADTQMTLDYIYSLFTEKNVVLFTGIAVIIGSSSLAFYYYYNNNHERRKRTDLATVCDIVIHPVKSCSGLRVQSAICTKWGLYDRDNNIYDRQFMVADAETGEFISARTQPTIVLVKPSFKDGCMILNAPGMTELAVPLISKNEERQRVSVGVWRSQFSALDCGDEAADWFSKYLSAGGIAVRLVTFDPEVCHRSVEKAEGRAFNRQGRPNESNSVTMFADGFPYLLASKASLEKLNSDIGDNKNAPVMRNFRPNIIVEGSSAFAEDDWRSVRISNAYFFNEKPCARCRLPNVNPDTGIVNAKHEPYNTLIKTRRQTEKYGLTSPMFGANLILDSGGGEIKLGDQLVASVVPS